MILRCLPNGPARHCPSGPVRYPSTTVSPLPVFSNEGLKSSLGGSHSQPLFELCRPSTCHVLASPTLRPPGGARHRDHPPNFQLAAQLRSDAGIAVQCSAQMTSPALNLRNPKHEFPPESTQFSTGLCCLPKQCLPNSPPVALSILSPQGDSLDLCGCLQQLTAPDIAEFLAVFF